MSNNQEAGKIDFLSKAMIFALVSVLVSVGSVVEIAFDGFNYGIDFAGGTEIQVQFNESVDTGRVRKFAGDLGYSNASVQSFGEGENEFLVRLAAIQAKSDEESNKQQNAMIKQITSGLSSEFSSAGAVIRRVDSVGPQIGDELKRNGLLAAFYALLMILIYVGLRFDFKFAPGAVFCLFHDAIITMGIFALLEREVNVTTMAAILTIIGYSLNDTIVTFDRIRENIVVLRGKPFDLIVNRSINDVLSRTILTSLTTLIAVAAMYFLGGGVIKDFAFTLGIGVLVGTYSSIYVASPLVIFVDRLQKAQSAKPA